MDIVQLCEIGMLVAFGFSWPFNIIKSWRSGTAKGKSVIFEFIVVFGYLVGVLGKFITWRQTGVLAYSVWFYFADIAMVTIDIVLYFRNTRLDRLARTEEPERPSGKKPYAGRTEKHHSLRKEPTSCSANGSRTSPRRQPMP